MITLAEYPVETILNLVRQDRAKTEFQLPDGRVMWIKTRTLRLQCFAENHRCVWCDRAGEIFRLQAVKDEVPHFNLYNTTRPHNGMDVLMTRDHMRPLSRGGADALDNLICLCTVCNWEKDNLLPLNFVHNYLIGHNYELPFSV